MMLKTCHITASARMQELQVAYAVPGQVFAGKASGTAGLRRNSALSGASGWRGPASGRHSCASVTRPHVFSGGLEEEHAGATPLWPRNRALRTAG